MTIDEIKAQWEEDCKLLKTDLREACLQIPYQLGTYEGIYAQEARVKFKRKRELDQRYALMHKWLYAFPTVKEECEAIGLTENPKKPIDKAEAERTIKTHPLYVELEERLENQELKLNMLRNFIDSLKYRNKQVENLINLDRYYGGSVPG